MSRYDGGPNAIDVPMSVPPTELKDLMIAYYNTHIVVNSNKAKVIELETAQQSHDEVASHQWKARRRERITSSNAGTIAKRRATTPVKKLVHQLLYTSFHGNTATKWGLSQEEASYYDYLKWLHSEKKSPQATVTINCGLVISAIYPWLAATPDGWVEDPQATPSQGLVEFKNPHSCRNLMIDEAITAKKCTCLVINNGTRSLKKTHDYYYQVQIAMFCTNTKWCDFFLRTTKDNHCERIILDEQMCYSILPKLREFYFCAILPELTLPHNPIREPGEWLEDKEAWLNRINTATHSAIE